jgi:hypothetical protein
MVHGLTPLQGFLNLLEARILSWPAMVGMLRPLVATLAETAEGVLFGAISLAATRRAASAFKARV